MIMMSLPAIALCALLTWLLLAKLRMGRYLYAVGGNAEAARLSGVLRSQKETG